MELWIIGGLAVAALVAILGLRLRSRRRAQAGDAKSIYPLW